MKYQILYKWAIQKTRVAKELEGAQGCERTSASALSKKLTSERAEGIIWQDLF
jgi:hypothetical protein